MSTKTLWTSKDVYLLTKHILPLVTDLKTALKQKRLNLYSVDGKPVSLGNLLFNAQKEVLEESSYMMESSIKQSLSAGNLKARLLSAIDEISMIAPELIAVPVPTPDNDPMSFQQTADITPPAPAPSAFEKPVDPPSPTIGDLTMGSLMDMVLNRFQADIMGAMDRRFTFQQALIDQRMEYMVERITERLADLVKREVESLQEYVTRPDSKPVAEQPTAQPETPDENVIKGVQVAIKKRGLRVDVVGLYSHEVTAVKNAFKEGDLSLRFYDPEDVKKSANSSFADHVVVCTRRISHTVSDKLRVSKHVTVIYVNGGITETVKKLRELQTEVGD